MAITHTPAINASASFAVTKPARDRADTAPAASLHQPRPPGEKPLIHHKRHVSLPLPGSAYRGKPFRVAVPDSSNGGIIATVTIMAELSKLFAVPVQLNMVLDHGHAPYGAKTEGQLTERVELLLSIGKQLGGKGTINGKPINSGFHANLMGCNTACVTFAPTGKLNPDKVAGAPVLDLIDNTAKDIAKSGGEAPVVLSTEATAKSPVYEKRILSASQELIKEGIAEKPPQVIRTGAGNKEEEPGMDWASIINNLMQLSPDPEVQKFVQNEVNKYVDKIPDFATKVYLCCTHFREVAPYIEKRLKEKGETAKIEVIDPINVQVRALIKTLLQIERPVDELDRGADAALDTTPIVLSSGPQKSVEPSVQRLLNDRLEEKGLPPAKAMYNVPFENFPVKEYEQLLNKQSEEIPEKQSIDDARTYLKNMQLPATPDRAAKNKQ